MKSYAMLQINGEYRLLPIDQLEAARLVAHSKGYYDVDCDPYPDNTKVVIKGDNISATFKGATLEEACNKLIERLWL